MDESFRDYVVEKVKSLCHGEDCGPCVSCEVAIVDWAPADRAKLRAEDSGAMICLAVCPREVTANQVVAREAMAY